MKTILLICVNYNSYDALSRYIASIENSNINNNLNLRVIVADNSTNYTSVESKCDKFRFEQLHTNENLGYIGAVTYVIKCLEIKLAEWDYLIISNVDLELSKDFFDRLINFAPPVDNLGWIAPAIFSRSENKNRNPKIIKRYNLRKLKLLLLMYRFPSLHYLYNRYFYKRKRVNSDNIKEIYAAHGSIMIFTNKFISNYKNIVYPSFLFGEEIFFGEEMRRYNLITIYEPSIICYDDDHVSTSRMKRRVFYRSNYQSLKLLILLYYNNE